MSEGIEPYTPYDFRCWWTRSDNQSIWGFRYNSRRHSGFTTHVIAKDELGAFIEATKYLEKLKKKADASRTRRAAKKGASK